MEWNDKYATGIQEIDDQHKMLFMMTSRLQTAIKIRKGETIIAKTFTELIDYTKYHFAAEEHEMDQVDFPDAALHRQFHNKLVSGIRDALLRIRNGESYNPIELLRFLNTWLIDHILEKDMKFSRFYKKNSNGNPAKQVNGVEWLTSRLQKLRDLLKSKLVETDVYISEKNKLLKTFINVHGSWTELELRNICDSLPSFSSLQLLTASEISEFKSAIAKTVDIGALLNGKSETDANALLEYLKMQNLITAS
jgi:hemerythrin-like metal-binding protein